MKIRAEQRDLIARNTIGAFLAEDLAKIAKDASFDGGTGVLSIVGWRGQRAKLTLDPDGRVLRQETPLGRVTTSRFDDGKLASTVLPTGLAVQLSYDEAGHLRRMDRDDGASESFQFDDAGNLCAYRLADGSSLRMEYGDGNRVTRLVDRGGAEVKRSYDAAGRVTEIVDPLGRTTRMRYGPLLGPERIEYPDGSTEQYTYAPTRCAQKVNGMPHAEYAFDDAGRIAAGRYADRQSFELAYDDAGRVTEAKSDDAVVACEYDDKGRIVAEDQGGLVVRYAYDADGQLESLTLPDGRAVRYEYDLDGRLSAARDWRGGVQRFDYAEGELPVRRALPNRLTETYASGRSGRFDAVELRSPTEVLWKTAVRRDLLDRVVTQTDSRRAERAVHYDRAGQVVAVVDAKSGAPVETFSYDTASNRVSDPRGAVRYDVMNRPVADAIFTYRHDALGNRVERTSRVGATKYVYGRTNLLTRVELPDGTIATYAYDAFGRRVRKQVGTTTIVYVWAGQQLVQERIDEDGAASTREYLYAPGTRRPLAMAYAGEVYFYHCDDLGTPQLLTNGDGQIAWSASYGAYGAAVVDLERVVQPLRLPGQYYDGELGLHYNRARYYDPRLGAYLSRDPAGPVAGLNAYQYADGNPINVVDPLGLWGESWPGWVKTAVSVTGAVVVGGLVGLAVAAALPEIALVGALTVAGAAGIVVAGVVGGAVGGALSAMMTKGGCVPCALLKGAELGAFGSVFFLAGAAAGLGVLGMAGAGAVAGAATYAFDHFVFHRPWSTTEFVEATLAGAALGGLGKYVAGKFAGAGGEEEPPPPPPPDEKPPAPAPEPAPEPEPPDPLRPLTADTSKGPYPAFAEARQRVADMPGTPDEKAAVMDKLLQRMSDDPELGWKATKVPSPDTPGLWLGDKNGLGMAVGPDGRVLTTNPQAKGPVSPFVQGTRPVAGGFKPDFDAQDANGNPVWRETKPTNGE